MLWNVVLVAVLASHAVGSSAKNTSIAKTFEVFEVRLQGGTHPNPFAIDCNVYVQGPAQSTRSDMVLSMFYDGNNEWAFRFNPDVEGAWTWRTNCSSPQYQGCFAEDTSDRDLPIKAGSGTTTDCRRNCVGHKYFGQHYDQECWCGDTYGKHGAATDCLPFSYEMEPDGQAGKRNCVWSVDGVNDSGLHAQHGVVQVRKGTARGGIVKHPLSPQQFAYEDGSDYLLVGLEADWLWALGLKDNDVAAYLDHLQSFGFNHFLVQAFSDHASWSEDLPEWRPPRYSPSKPTPWASNDHRMLSLDYFENYDELLALLDQRGMVAHLMLYVGNKNVQWQARGSLADEIYWRTCLARWGAYNSMLWDVSKEAGSYGVGKPYIIDRLQYITHANPHNRLITAHSGLEWSNRCTEVSTDKSLCTMMTRQKHFQSDGDVLAQEHNYYNDMVQALKQDPDIPVSNLEFFYEAGSLRGCNGSCCNGCATGSLQVGVMRRVMWDLYMAGGSGAWYNCDVSWDVMVTNTSSVGFSYVKNLHAFWSQVKFIGMERRNDMIKTANASLVQCLAGNGEVIVHARSGASFTLSSRVDLIASAHWFDPVTGKTMNAAPSVQYTPPKTFSDDAVLYLEMESDLVI